MQNRPVLVVDDVAVNRTVMQVLLARLGYAAEGAGDGWEMLRMAEQKDYDIIFLDLNMPHLDGLSALRMLRSTSLGERPRVIVLTASLEELKDRAACLEAGADQFLSKPVHCAALQEVLLQERSRENRPDEACELLDNRVLEPLLKLGPDFFRNLVEETAKGFERLLVDAECGMSTCDGRRVADAAHGLRGSSGSLGAMRLSRSAAALETIAKRGELDKARSMLDALHRQTAEALKELRGVLAKS